MMARGPLFNEKYRPQFSGHETFPLRYGWLKKAFDAISETEQDAENKSVFLNDDAIARLGVGKNMVASMRHWATAVGIIREDISSNRIVTTELGRKIFGAVGIDPFLEHPSTLWLIHWQLCGKPDKTTWYWVFNHYTSDTFDRDFLVKGLERLASDRQWTRVAGTTIKRDVECFVRTYVARSSSDKWAYEDTLESPLAELGLIRPIGKRDGFRLLRGQKSTLGDGVFLYSVIQFWKRYSEGTSTISFEALAYEPGSPGRVFLLDENDLADRLVDIEDYTDGAYRWSETAGLKQVIRDYDLTEEDQFRLVELDYPESN
jgi:hypothetical protein